MPISTLRNMHSAGPSRQTGSGHSEIRPWEVLRSRISEYQLQRYSFSGCFSEVAECKDKKNKKNMAIKILKRRARDSQEPNRELAMLSRIRDLDLDNIVRFVEGFEHEGHVCLAFEMLDKTLHELLRERCGRPLPLQEIRPIAQQLLSALESLKTVGVIHANIKPHNIMLVNQRDQPLRVKLIDFGSAVRAAEVKRGVIMQPVAYRSPDVILGFPISEAIDMWSLGGVLATMYLGSLLFPQRCQYYLIKAIVETLGQPKDSLLNDGTNTLRYFSMNEDTAKSTWRLKTAEEYKSVASFPPLDHRGGSTRFSYLSELVMLYPEENLRHRIRFVSLLRRMLRVNPQSRITPSEALRHSFISPSKADNESIRHFISGLVSSVVKPADISAASSRTDEEPREAGDSAAVDTAGRASAITSSAEVASAATELINKDSAVGCTGAENIHAVCVNDEDLDGAAVSTDVATAYLDGASVKPGVTCLNETSPAGGEASERTVRSADDTASADEALNKSVGEESNDTGRREEDSAPCCSGVENLPAVYIVGADAGGPYDQVTDADDDKAAAPPASTEVTASVTDKALTAPTMTEPDEVAVSSPSTGESASPPLTIDSIDLNSSSDGASATGSRKLFGRMCKALCCCCSPDVVE